MKYSLLILIGFVSGIRALVHYIKLDKGNGCVTKAAATPAPTRVARQVEFKVGEAVDDDNVCGVFVCQSTEGDALIYYCQVPVPFVVCKEDGISTVTAFPECCWKCVTYVSCSTPPET